MNCNFSPDYRRFAESTARRIRKNSERTTSERVGRMLVNLVLLAGLWGMPLYARWMVADAQRTVIPAEAIIGRWRPIAGSKGSDHAIEFTREGKFQLSRGGTVKLTAHYRFDEYGDVVLYDLDPRLIVDHRKAPEAQYRFTATFTEDGLTASAPHEHGIRSLREIQYDRLGLPPPFGRTYFMRTK